ncbi:hypothetical protein VNO78_06911 [Psophocarpus tetragonolobus]|uniref:Uncharacterized protein n=1 Tax=Psophocarpus tetragonolobus TaxID=3891 RepID=A0AAN9T293_PSOTE
MIMKVRRHHNPKAQEYSQNGQANLADKGGRKQRVSTAQVHNNKTNHINESVPTSISAQHAQGQPRSFKERSVQISSGVESSMTKPYDHKLWSFQGFQKVVGSEDKDRRLVLV